MKQKDIALILVVVFISGVFSIIVTKLLITTPKNRQEKVEVVESISPDLTAPSTKYFNSKSIDPTQIIKIGNTNNNQPFNKQ